MKNKDKVAYFDRIIASYLSGAPETSVIMFKDLKRKDRKEAFKYIILLGDISTIQAFDWYYGHL